MFNILLNFFRRLENAAIGEVEAHLRPLTRIVERLNATERRARASAQSHMDAAVDFEARAKVMSDRANKARDVALKVEALFS